MSFITSDIEGHNENGLTLRELRGLDKTMQTYREALVDNIRKLRTLDENIASEETKLKTVTEGDRPAIERSLRDLHSEREARIEAALASLTALRSQISRIEDTINQIITNDSSLAEKIRTLFREQGNTIFSILTALGLAISTLVLALTGGSSGAAAASTPTPAENKWGSKEWVK